MLQVNPKKPGGLCRGWPCKAMENAVKERHGVKPCTEEDWRKCPFVSGGTAVAVS